MDLFITMLFYFQKLYFYNSYLAVLNLFK